MIKFIKKLLFGAPAEETVKEILTPPVVTNAAPNSNKTLEATYIPPAKPVNKVRAISDSKPAVVKTATQPKPANKNRRPRNKPKAKTK